MIPRPLPALRTAPAVFLAAALALASPDPSPAAPGTTRVHSVKPSEGDRFLHADFFCWIPDQEGPLQSVIIHQHGCTNASPDKHPPISGDWHWRALAKKHRAALLVPFYRVAGRCDEWNDPESGSERALLGALAELARQSGRPELAELPWLMWGHSGGSSWSAQMILRHPGRVLAASFRGGCHKQFGDADFRARFVPAARDLPLLLVWGKRESVPESSHFVSWDPMNRMFEQLRSVGSRTCRVIDPRSEHGCDDSRLVSLAFFDAVLSVREGDKGSETGVLAEIVGLEDREWTPENLSDPSLVWLPDDSVRSKWREFSTHGTLRPPRPPRSAPQLTAAPDGSGHTRLSWDLTPEIDGGLRVLRIERDGKPWREFGVGPGDLLATARDSTPEPLRVEGITDESPGPHSYTLTFLDAAGQASPPGEARTPAP